ncbi:uncharacterized protein [Elaeis guineensis]|uniref:uncharacterized protein n=1 Tax=Elaeis guineensis var. tenera TaxID=51953 RepID=UPI003C6D7432
MVDGVGGPIIGLKLLSLKVPREQLLHNPQSKGWVTVEPIIGCRGGIADCIDPLIDLPKLPLNSKVLGGAAQDVWECFSIVKFNDSNTDTDGGTSSYRIALLSFVEGPPFTLQRLCEILLNPKGTYTNLSKLALALEKNLLVTSTLTMCTDPYPTEVVQKPDEPDKASEVPSGQTDPVPNGVETVAGDGDEEMTDAEADENTTNTDSEMQEEKVTETSDGDSDIRSDANPSQELCTSSEQQNR